MAFAPVSPLIVDDLPKFLSMVYHQFINQVIYTFANFSIADRLVIAALDRGFTVKEIMNDEQSEWNQDLLYQI
ncbi:unnamed protein product [Rotaria sp. Silwood1]|nr:unnamed protein product [Rotaria sp. Silwood1]CAF4874061.1 unnamed protein product [Rotaria sp. Silwood1]